MIKSHNQAGWPPIFRRPAKWLSKMQDILPGWSSRINLKNLESIENSLSDSLNEQSILLHGYNKTCWELLKIAGQKGYDCRVGFEDVLTLPTGALATSNEELVKEASALLGK